MYFSYDHEDGIEFHETEEQAKEFAQKSLELWRQKAIGDGEWDENVELIIYGKILGRTELVNQTPGTCDYKLQNRG